jgi:hypothetical protein
MKDQDFFNKITFYFENAPTRTYKQTDEALVSKVREFLTQLKPQKMWEERGIVNKKTKMSIYTDFVMILDEKLIVCEVEKSNLPAKFALFDGVKMFDEIWFFTDIPIEKNWLHYKFGNKLKMKQKFFGLNKKGEVVEIKIH